MKNKFLKKVINLIFLIFPLRFTKKKVVKRSKKIVKIIKENYSDSKSSYQMEEITCSYEEKTELSLFQGKENDKFEGGDWIKEEREPHSSTEDVEKEDLENKEEEES